MKITPEYLYAISPSAKASIVDGIVAAQELLVANDIVDPVEVAMFFGRSAVETGGFNRLEESLYYTSTKRLREVWPARFKTDAAATPYVRNPQKLANFVYNGRMGNRVGSDDGWLNRGSGLMQTTGHDNMAALEAATGLQVVEHPELLRSMPAALEAAAVFWKANNLKRFVAARDIPGLCKAIQGAQQGLADQRLYTDRALRAASATRPAKGRQDAEADMLRHGAKGAGVETLQRLLQARGFYLGGRIDGDYGDGTEDAVKAYQAAHGLTPDGVAGPATMASLNSAPAVPAAPEDRPAPSGKGEPAVPGFGALLLTLLKLILGIFFGGNK